VLPVSAAAIDVARMTADPQFSAQQVAAALSREAALAVEVLRLANSQYFAASIPKTANLEEAAVRVGLRRVGEIALATSALNGIVNCGFPWLNTALLSQQSIAAGAALRLLMQRAGVSDDGGLFLSALTHDLGRVVLGTLYPELYQQLLRACVAGGTLLEQEDRVFPCRHVQVMAQLLAKWGVQPSACVPLRHTLSTYGELESLNEPLRSKVELCKLAILMGRIAAGRWEPWDVIEPMPGPIAAKLGLRSLDDILEQTRRDLPKPQPCQAAESPAQPCEDAGKTIATRYAGYVTLSSSRGDLLPSILASLGVEVHPLKPESLAVEEHVIVNCLGVPAKRLAPYFGSGIFPVSRCVITDLSRFADYQALATTIALPGSAAALRGACRAVAAEAPLAHVS
jgi:HD-like signal output (HDOD) protein